MCFLNDFHRHTNDFYGLQDDHFSGFSARQLYFFSICDRTLYKEHIIRVLHILFVQSQ